MAEGLRRTSFGAEYDGTAMSESLRDTDRALRGLTTFVWVDMEAAYVEPFFVSFASEPKCVELVRVRDRTALEQPVACGQACHFVWEGSRARITSIDGLTPSQSRVFRMTFRASYEGSV
jgi:hypothetical protein